MCGGDGQSCLGCDGRPNSGKTLDQCGICGGDSTTCAGCDGVPNSGKRIDECGICMSAGPAFSMSCAGCDDVPNSRKTFDACGVCGGSSGCVGCDGVAESGKIFDDCNVCGGDNTACETNFCDPSDLYKSQTDSTYNRKVWDACNVCGGDGTTCVDCDGVPNGNKINDQCGICDGGNLCLDCENQPNGGRTYDDCGVCGGNGFGCPLAPADSPHTLQLTVVMPYTETEFQDSLVQARYKQALAMAAGGPSYGVYPGGIDVSILARRRSGSSIDVQNTVRYTCQPIENCVAGG